MAPPAVADLDAYIRNKIASRTPMLDAPVD
jgi:hypothetical protein